MGRINFRAPCAGGIAITLITGVRMVFTQKNGKPADWTLFFVVFDAILAIVRMGAESPQG